MIYRRLPTPLHAAGAAAGIAYCLALALAALITSNPVALAGVTIAIACALLCSRLGRELRRALLLGLPLAVMITAVNALVTRDGLTVIVRLGQLPLVGHVDVTLEATAYGALLGLRGLALVLCGALYTAAVDPDEVLRLFRRLSFRSALTATLATRLVPVLLRDARRFADAQRCRARPAPSRLALIRASTAGALDRALDLAAALELRGYGATRSAGRAGRFDALRTGRPAAPGAPARRRRSRHARAFAAAAGALLVLAVVARTAALAPFRAYPSQRAPAGAVQLALAVAFVASALAPFLERRGIAR